MFTGPFGLQISEDNHHAYVMKKQGITPMNFNEPFREINSNTEFECPNNLKLFQNQWNQMV